jgi:tyrosine-protein phosphatase SIW14
VIRPFAESYARIESAAMNRAPRTRPIASTVLLVAIIVAGLAVLWHKQVRDHLIPRNFGVVEEGVLYRSGRLTPRATRLVVERHAIKTIVDLGAYDKDPDLEEQARRTAEALGVTRYVFPLHGDGTGNPNAYVAALRVITDPANQPVLVHCSAGAERTSGCVMLYEKAVHGRAFAETYPLMTRHKHDPARNPLLMSYLADHAGAILAALRAGTFIDGYPAPDLAPVRSEYSRDHPAPSPTVETALTLSATPPLPGAAAEPDSPGGTSTPTP